MQFGDASLFFDATIQAAMIGEFHDEVSLPFKLIERIDVDDVGVIHPSASAGFSVETIHLRGIIHLLLLDQLHGDETFQHRVERAIDDAVTAGRDDAAQFKLPEHHGHHDGMTALAARHGGEWREIAGDKNFGVAPSAGDHP